MLKALSGAPGRRQARQGCRGEARCDHAGSGGPYERDRARRVEREAGRARGRVGAEVDDRVAVAAERRVGLVRREQPAGEEHLAARADAPAADHGPPVLHGRDTRDGGAGERRRQRQLDVVAGAERAQTRQERGRRDVDASGREGAAREDRAGRARASAASSASSPAGRKAIAPEPPKPASRPPSGRVLTTSIWRCAFASSAVARCDDRSVAEQERRLEAGVRRADVRHHDAVAAERGVQVPEPGLGGLGGEQSEPYRASEGERAASVPRGLALRPGRALHPCHRTWAGP